MKPDGAGDTSSYAREIRLRNLKRVALFGTRFTIETRMFEQLSGITEVVTPKPGEVSYIHDSYLQIVKQPSGVGRDRYRGLTELAHTLCRRDAVEAIVLAGTELSLLFNEANTDFPRVDCAQVHMNAIMRRIFDEPAPAGI